ncbi:VC0807 family protein [Aquihabitans daechungensis]|uniref:VC0807 family protein n=1 Tax=Aquihabitans daechungensis TaxID=1052257 RepID=UPI003BA39D21
MEGPAPIAEPTEDGPPELAKRTIVAAIVRRGGPRLLEASFIPSALFYTALTFGSIGAAYLIAIGWTYGCLGRRLWQGAQVTGVLVLASVGITIRTALAVGSGSTFVYFAQPIIGTVITACVFLGSIAVGRPLIAKLAHDFWPITEEQAAIPRVRRLMVGLTVLWAGVNLATASMTLILLLSLDLTTFLAAKQITGLAITISAIAVTIAWSHRTASDEGIIAPSRRRAQAPIAPVIAEPALIPLAA